VAGKNPSASVIDSSGLSLPTEPGRRSSSLLEHADNLQQAVLRVVPLVVFVVGHEVEAGDADGNDDMSGDSIPMARKDLVADGIRIAL
jgi:hypothetical protein